jgi:transcriptional regulator with XRE-family HTH domain
MTTRSKAQPVDSDDSVLLRLQDRFLRAFAALRRAAGRTQRDVAEATGWQQPYVNRLEGPSSALIGSMARVERYAQACGSTCVLTFLDPRTGQVVRTMALGDAGVPLESALREPVRAMVELKLPRERAVNWARRLRNEPSRMP